MRHEFMMAGDGRWGQVVNRVCHAARAIVGQAHRLPVKLDGKRSACPTIQKRVVGSASQWWQLIRGTKPVVLRESDFVPTRASSVLRN